MCRREHRHSVVLQHPPQHDARVGAQKECPPCGPLSDDDLPGPSLFQYTMHDDATQQQPWNSPQPGSHDTKTPNNGAIRGESGTNSSAS